MKRRIEALMLVVVLLFTSIYSGAQLNTVKAAEDDISLTADLSGDGEDVINLPMQLIDYRADLLFFQYYYDALLDFSFVGQIDPEGTEVFTSQDEYGEDMYSYFIDNSEVTKEEYFASDSTNKSIATDHNYRKGLVENALVDGTPVYKDAFIDLMAQRIYTAMQQNKLSNTSGDTANYPYYRRLRSQIMGDDTPASYDDWLTWTNAPQNPIAADTSKYTDGTDVILKAGAHFETQLIPVTEGVGQYKAAYYITQNDYTVEAWGYNKETGEPVQLEVTVDQTGGAFQNVTFNVDDDVYSHVQLVYKMNSDTTLGNFFELTAYGYNEVSVEVPTEEEAETETEVTEGDGEEGDTGAEETTTLEPETIIVKEVDTTKEISSLRLETTDPNYYMWSALWNAENADEGLFYFAEPTTYAEDVVYNGIKIKPVYKPTLIYGWNDEKTGNDIYSNGNSGVLSKEFDVVSGLTYRMSVYCDDRTNTGTSGSLPATGSDNPCYYEVIAIDSDGNEVEIIPRTDDYKIIRNVDENGNETWAVADSLVVEGIEIPEGYTKVRVSFESKEGVVTCLGNNFILQGENNENSALGTLEASKQKDANGGFVDDTSITSCYDYVYYMLNHMFDPNNVLARTYESDTFKTLQLLPVNGGYGFLTNISGRTETDRNGVRQAAPITYDTENGIIRNTNTTDESTEWGFFPLDADYLGDDYDENDAEWGYSTGYFFEDETNSGHKHNYHYAMVSSGKFVYRASDNLYFDFTGDDDVYLFVNNKLAMDIGGAHKVAHERVNLNDMAAELGLEEGEVYEFNFFYLERHTDYANLRVLTNMRITDKNAITSKTAYVNGSERVSESAVSTGTDLTYSLTMKNISTNNMNDSIKYLHFVDPMLGVDIGGVQTNEDGTYKRDANGKFIAKDWVQGAESGIYFSDNTDPKLTKITDLDITISWHEDGTDKTEFYDLGSTTDYLDDNGRFARLKEVLDGTVNGRTSGYPTGTEVTISGFKYDGDYVNETVHEDRQIVNIVGGDFVPVVDGTEEVQDAENYSHTLYITDPKEYYVWANGEEQDLINIIPQDSVLYENRTLEDIKNNPTTSKGYTVEIDYNFYDEYLDTTEAKNVTYNETDNSAGYTPVDDIGKYQGATDMIYYEIIVTVRDENGNIVDRISVKEPVLINLYDLNEDLYVLDYGIPVELNTDDEYGVLYNDNLLLNDDDTAVSEIKGVEKANTDVDYYGSVKFRTPEQVAADEAAKDEAGSGDSSGTGTGEKVEQDSIDVDTITDWTQLTGTSEEGTTVEVSKAVISSAFGNDGLRGFYAANLGPDWNRPEFKDVPVFGVAFAAGSTVTGVIIDGVKYPSDNVNVCFGGDCMYIHQDLLQITNGKSEQVFIITAEGNIAGNGSCTFAVKVKAETAPDTSSVDTSSWTAIPIQGSKAANVKNTYSMNTASYSAYVNPVIWGVYAPHTETAYHTNVPNCKITGNVFAFANLNDNAMTAVWVDGVKYKANEDKFSTNGDHCEISLSLFSEPGTHYVAVVGNNTTTFAIKTEGEGEDEVVEIEKKMASIKYTPEKLMEGIDEFLYTVNLKKDASIADEDITSENGIAGMQAKIKVMPANIVYYEDNFSQSGTDADGKNGIMYSGNVTTVEGGKEVTEQSNRLDMHYGYDKTYANGGDLFSNGSATELSHGSVAAFEFTGNGFDIISRTNLTTGALFVNVYEKTEENGVKLYKNDAGVIKVQNGTKGLVQSMLVDTYYKNGDLYQIPVIAWRNGDGAKKTYVVVITSYGRGDTSKTIYIDGLRIYNPVKGNEIAEGEYEKIGEKDAKVEEMKNLIFGEGFKFDYEDPLNSTLSNDPKISLVKYPEYGAEETAAGRVAAFLTGKTVVESTKTFDQNMNLVTKVGDQEVTRDMMAYAIQGPNNELYLNKDSGIGFYFEAVEGSEESARTLQIGVKKPHTNNNAAFIFQYWTGTDATTGLEGWATMAVPLKEGTVEPDTDIVTDIKSGTEVYFNFDSLIPYLPTVDGKKCLLIRVEGQDQGQFISLTNIKYNNYELSPLDESIFYNPVENKDLAVADFTYVKGDLEDNGSGQATVEGKYVSYKFTTEVAVEDIKVKFGDTKVNAIKRTYKDVSVKDENGFDILDPVLDANGEPVYDEAGNPLTTVRMERQWNITLKPTSAANEFKIVTYDRFDDYCSTTVNVVGGVK